MGSGVAGSPSWLPGEVIDGRYEVLGVLGQGGMGVVHHVRHREWGVDLAVKSPRPELFQRDGDRERFAAEAEVWELLGLHPNVCGCHYVRMLGGVPRVFAEYVAGGSLAEWIASRRLYQGDRPTVLARILDVAIQTAWGLEHAHSHDLRLVHQDVKPANVLLDVSADGALTPKVTDFGLAKARTVATSAPAGDAPPGASILVSTGGMTPAYASPEQADKEPVGRSSDIYSFAVSVLEMFTGGVTWMVGYAAGAALAAHRAARHRKPGLPDLPDEVATLLEQCLGDKENRPPSMEAVAGGLAEIYRRVLGQVYPRAQPVAANLRADELNNRGLSLVDLGRHAEAAQAFQAAIAADPRHLEATYNDGLRRWRSGAITDDALISRLEAARTASGDSWPARYLLAEIHLERGDLTAADELLRTVEAMEPQHPGVTRALQAVRSGRLTDARCVKIRPMGWHEYEDWIPFNGEMLKAAPPTMKIRLTADGRRAMAVSGRHLGLWDIHSGQRVALLDDQPKGKRIDVMADVSADGRFALCGKDSEVWLRDLTGGRELWRAGPADGLHAPILAVALGADASVAAAACRGNVMIWEARTGRFRLRFGGHASAALFQLSPDGRFLLTGGGDEDTVRLWDTGTGACVRDLLIPNRNVSAVAVSADGRSVATACYWEGIRVWDLTTGREVCTLHGHARSVNSLSWSSDGRFLLSGADDDTVRLWNLDSGRCLRTFPITRDRPRAVLLEPRTGRAVAAGEKTVCWWTLPSRYLAPPQLNRPRRHAELTTLDSAVTALVDAAERAIAARRFTEAHGLLTKARATRGYERAAHVLSAWRTLAGVLPRVGVRASWQVREITGHPASVFAVDMSPDGARAASGGRTLQVWDTTTGRCLRSIDDHPSRLTAVRLSSDQRRVLAATQDGQLGVWSVDTGDCLVKIAGRQTNGADAAYFSADGRWALVGAVDNAIRLWDLDSGRCMRTVAGHGHKTRAVWLSPDGRRAASSGSDHMVRIWDMDTGECLHALAGHTGSVESVSLSPSGRLAVSGGDRTFRLWDIASGECVHVQRDLPDAVELVRFVDDGRFVMSVGTTGAIRIWDPRTGRCLHTLDTGHDGVYSIADTPDGRFVLSAGGTDAALRLWEFDWDLGTGSTPHKS
jgi:WD40 repeat protein/serine/threonine protein kinase